MDEEEMTMGIENISTKDVESISWLSPYIPPRKSTAKVTKHPNSLKFKVFTPLLPEEVFIKDELLASVPFLKMEDWDLGDYAKFLQLETSKLLKSVYYEEVGITRLEPMK